MLVNIWRRKLEGNQMKKRLWILGWLAILAFTGALDARAVLLYVSSPGSDSVLRYDGTTGAFLGVFASGNGLHFPSDILVGPDGNIYVSNNLGIPAESGILRFDRATGAPRPSPGNSGAFFVSPGSGGLFGPEAFTFGPDGRLYATSVVTGGGLAHGGVLRYDGTTGAFLDTFVLYSNSNLDFPNDIVFGPDGNLYVSHTTVDGQHGGVLRYDGTTGGLLGDFAVGGPLVGTGGILFAPNGDLYVSNRGGDSILRYDGKTGAFIDTFVPSGSGGLQRPRGLAFGPDGDLYVSSSGGPQGVLRYNQTSGAFIDVFAANARSPQGIVFASSVVPEPGTMVLLAVGLALIARILLRRAPQAVYAPSPRVRT